MLLIMDQLILMDVFFFGFVLRPVGGLGCQKSCIFLGPTIIKLFTITNFSQSVSIITILVDRFIFITFLVEHFGNRDQLHKLPAVPKLV